MIHKEKLAKVPQKGQGVKRRKRENLEPGRRGSEQKSKGLKKKDKLAKKTPRGEKGGGTPGSVSPGGEGEKKRPIEHT